MKSYDCRICEHCEFVLEEYPSPEEPIFVRRWYKCNITNNIFLTTRELKIAYEKCQQKKIRIGSGIPRDILSEIDTINSIWRGISQSGDKLINIKEDVIVDLASPCLSVVDFERKIGTLSIILEMNISSIRKLLYQYNISYEKNEKSLKLLKRLFENKNLLTSELINALDLLRKIIAIRNKIPPYHSPSSEAKDTLGELDIKYPCESQMECQTNAKILLQKFLESLRVIRIYLAKI